MGVQVRVQTQIIFVKNRVSSNRNQLFPRSSLSIVVMRVQVRQKIRSSASSHSSHCRNILTLYSILCQVDKNTVILTKNFLTDTSDSERRWSPEVAIMSLIFAIDSELAFDESSLLLVLSLLLNILYLLLASFCLRLFSAK